ncbi:MAG: Flp family type IVb pilin [Rhodospirillales bacterium]|nr:Flp family type IVb pilin [Rhodospirillales bacterium]
MQKILRSWLFDRCGATALEYALIAAGIALAIVAAILVMGDSVAFLFSSADSALNTAAADI